MPVYSEEMCRVCLQEYRDDFESVFTEDSAKSQLSNLGILYEELVQMTICYQSGEPHFLCNYCNLQLKLFHKFKTKAVETCAKFTQFVKEKEPYSDTIKLEHVLEDSCEDAVYKCELVTHDVKEESTSHKLDDEPEEMGQEEAIEDDEDDEDDLEYEFEDVQYLEDTDMDDLPKLNLSEKMGVAEENAEIAKRRMRQSTGIYPCNSCEQEFGKKIDLIRHRREQHKRERFPCNQCPKKFYSEDQLRVHLNVHWGLPAYQCELCEKQFKQKVHFVNHMNFHDNKRDVQCDLCGKGFLTKSDLKIHKRMHTDERRYECDICKKRFRAHTHMKNHRYTHLGKTLECEFCQQMYTTPATLKIHIQSVHQNLCPYLCSLCNKWFKRKHHLVAHLKVHSPKEDNSGEIEES